MNKAVKDALAKGKADRIELDKKTVEAARKRAEKIEAEVAAYQAGLKDEAERCLSYIPDRLAKAVAKREASFSIMTYEDDKDSRYSAVAKLLEPALKKMGLQFRTTTSTHYEILTCDPDTGYDARYYHFEVIVPDEGL
jgi:hypothetical protein